MLLTLFFFLVLTFNHLEISLVSSIDKISNDYIRDLRFNSYLHQEQTLQIKNPKKKNHLKKVMTLFVTLKFRAH